MNPTCMDVDGNELLIGDIIDVLDSEGNVIRTVKIIDFHDPVRHEDGTQEYTLVDIESLSHEALEQGYVSTERVRKSNQTPDE